MPSPHFHPRTLPGSAWPPLPTPIASQVWDAYLALDRSQWLDPEQIVQGQLTPASHAPDPRRGARAVLPRPLPRARDPSGRHPDDGGLPAAAAPRPARSTRPRPAVCTPRGCRTACATWGLSPPRGRAGTHRRSADRSRPPLVARVPPAGHRVVGRRPARLPRRDPADPAAGGARAPAPRGRGAADLGRWAPRGDRDRPVVGHGHLTRIPDDSSPGSGGSIRITC